MGLNIGKGLFSADEDIYGTKPELPGYYPEASYAKTIQSNINLAPKAQKLAGITNQYNQDTLSGMIESLFPGYQSVLGDIRGNIGSRVKGELNPDALARIQDRGAIWGQDSGVGAASPQVDFRNLRNYGLDVMATQRQGEADAKGYLDFMRGTLLPSPVDIRDYSINPATALTDEWARDYEAAKVKASPDPAKRGQFDSKMAILGMVLSAYGGGAGYQNSYKSPWQGGGGQVGGGVGGGGSNWWSQDAYAPNNSGEFNMSDYNRMNQMYGGSEGGGVLGSFY